MIFGDCPYCGAAFTEAMPTTTPAYAKLTCEACGKEFWECYSRLDPCAYTMEEFEAKYSVDSVTKIITERNQVPPYDANDPVHRIMRDELLRAMTDWMLYGVASVVPRGLIK